MQSPTNDQRQRDGADEEQIIDWWNEPDALQRYPNCIEWIRNLRQMRPRKVEAVPREAQERAPSGGMSGKANTAYD